MRTCVGAPPASAAPSPASWSGCRRGPQLAPTYAAQVGRDGRPHPDAASAQPLADGELDVEERDPLEGQGDEVGDEEGPCKQAAVGGRGGTRGPCGCCSKPPGASGAASSTDGHSLPTETPAQCRGAGPEGRDAGEGRSHGLPSASLSWAGTLSRSLAHELPATPRGGRRRWPHCAAGGGPREAWAELGGPAHLPCGWRRKGEPCAARLPEGVSRGLAPPEPTHPAPSTRGTRSLRLQGPHDKAGRPRLRARGRARAAGGRRPQRCGWPSPGSTCPLRPTFPKA